MKSMTTVTIRSRGVFAAITMMQIFLTLQLLLLLFLLVTFFFHLFHLPLSSPSCFLQLLFLLLHRIIGLVVKVFASEALVLDSIPPFSVKPVTQNLALHRLPFQESGATGSALSLVEPVSVYCDCVRLNVSSATSISVWQRVK